MTQKCDQIICREMAFACELGICEHEKGVRQKIIIDFEADVLPGAKHADQVQDIQLDYFRAYQMIENLLSEKRFNLIETVAQDVARILLAHFAIQSVQVSVTKFPADMPQMKSVSYVCRREKGNGA